MIKRHIYVASSWRNEKQPYLVKSLRERGHEVYDFREPEPGVSGFSWEEIDRNWRIWTNDEYISALGTMPAITGYYRDLAAMRQSDTCVLLLPSGNSAHLEAGWFSAQRDKELFILLESEGTLRPDLMYKMASWVGYDWEELFSILGESLPYGGSAS